MSQNGHQFSMTPAKFIRTKATGTETVLDATFNDRNVFLFCCLFGIQVART